MFQRTFFELFIGSQPGKWSHSPDHSPPWSPGLWFNWIKLDSTESKSWASWCGELVGGVRKQGLVDAHPAKKAGETVTLTGLIKDWRMSFLRSRVDFVRKDGSEHGCNGQAFRDHFAVFCHMLPPCSTSFTTKVDRLIWVSNKLTHALVLLQLLDTLCLKLLTINSQDACYLQPCFGQFFNTNLFYSEDEFHQ